MWSPSGSHEHDMTVGDARPEEDIEQAVRQIISRAVAPAGVVGIFAAAGLAKPDTSILLIPVGIRSVPGRGKNWH
jgi:Domain of unknown function (DUF3387)